MKTKRDHSQVLPIAQTIVSRLASYCERIEIAGSLRRMAPHVGDIEIVCVPKFQEDLFGNATGASLLDGYLDSLIASGKIYHGDDKKWGEKYKKFLFDTTGGHTFQVDLFIQPDPATWGVNFMIRTGSAEFSQRMVTQRDKGGMCPPGFAFISGRLYYAGQLLETPEERDVFDALGVEWVEPHERN